MVRMPDGSLKYEHTLVWEAEHGPLREGWVIHHRDGDPLNNALENLEAMSKGAHTSMHLRGRMGSHVVVDGVEGKYCAAGDHWKPLAEFPKNGRSKAGTTVYRPVCKDCYVLQQRLENENAPTEDGSGQEFTPTV
jgi:hypothetical protein